MQEEKLQFASKKYPAYFRHAMVQLSAGVELLLSFLLTLRWRDIWRRYEMLRRTEYSRKANKGSILSLWARFRVWWLGLDDYYRCIAPIVGLNVLVWCLWRVPRCSNVMVRYFLCQPYVSKVSSLCVRAELRCHV